MKKILYLERVSGCILKYCNYYDHRSGPRINV